jgi:asparagine synthase (glutamine-hydrolysing)
MGSLVAILTRGQTPDAEVAKRMLGVAPHRGAKQDFLVQDHCVLGASNSEALPDATLARGAGTIAVFVGVLDNLSDLLRRFSLGTSEAGDPSPAEMLVSLFARLGEETPTVLRGMYAAIISDGSKLWGFRDHLAFGQLFYRNQANGFFAATEPKQVLAGSGLPMQPDLDVVERMFYGDIDDDTPCALKGVERLPKATLLLADQRTARRRRYWDPQALIETACLTPEEVESRFSELMRQAVDRMLTGSDVVALSGGVDSPTVAAFAAPLHLERYGTPISALSEIYPDFPAVDERKYIELVAKQLGIPSHTFNPESGPLDGILEWVRLCDSPIPVHPPAEASEFFANASKLGFHNVLGGDLAEFVMDRRYGLLSHLFVRGKWSAVRDQIRDQRAHGYRTYGIAYQLLSTVVPRFVFVARERLRKPDELFPDWLDMGIVNRVNAGLKLSPREMWQKEQVAFFVGPGLGLEADEVISAYHGVRARRPWIDVDLAEFFLSLPAEVKFPDYVRKSLVKKLLRGTVPDVILDRTDRTYFTDRLMGRIDYPALRHWLLHPRWRMPGVDYERLGDRLNREDLSHIGHYKWAVDLAKTHAFLSLW